MSVFMACCMILAQGSKSSNQTDVYCGSRCVFLAIKSLGAYNGTFKEFQTQIGDPGLQGYSLEQLSEIAETFKLKTAIVRTSLANLEARNDSCICITLVRENHFALLTDIDSSSRLVSIVDYPKIIKLPIDTFLAQWKPYCLLVSESPLESEESISRRLMYRKFGKLGIIVIMLGAALGAVAYVHRVLRMRRVAALAVFATMLATSAGCGNDFASRSSPASKQTFGLKVENETIDLGVIELEKKVQKKKFEFRLLNSSGQSFNITDIGTSCGCTVATVSTRQIRPHEAATISGHVAVTNFNEKKATYLTIRTDDPNHPVMMVQIEWETRSPFYVPNNRIEVGNIPLGTNYETSIPVYARSEFGCLAEMAVTALATSRAAEVVFKASPDHKHAAQPTHQPCGHVMVRIPGRDELSQIQDTIVLSARHHDNQYDLNVPLSAQVVGKYAVSPVKLVLLVKDRLWQMRKKILVTSTEGQEFVVARVNIEDSRLVLDVQTQETSSTTHVLDLGLSVSRAIEDEIKTQVLVEVLSDSGVSDVVKVPVSIYRR